MRLLPLLIFFLVLPSVFAANLYESWVYPGDTFTVGGELFSVSKGSDPYQILVSKGSEEHVLEFRACDRSQDKLVEYCFNASDYVACAWGDYDCPDKDEEPDDWCCPYDVEHVRFDAGAAVWAARIVVREVQPEMSVTRLPTSTLLELGESTTVKVTFKNTGEEPVKSAKYIEHIPEGFTVVSALDFTRIPNGLSLAFTLSPHKEQTFRYLVKPVEYVSGVFTGNLSYTYGGEAKTIIPSTFTINVPSPFDIDRAFEPAQPSLGEELTYIYTLQNKEPDEMDVRIEFSGLAGLGAVIPNDIVVEDDLFIWEGSLDDELLELEFPFIVKKTGTYTVDASATMEVNHEEFFHRGQDSVTVDVKELTPEIRFSTDKPIAGNNLTVRVLLDNKAGDTDYFRMKGKLTGDMPGVTKTYALDTVSKGVYPLLGEHVFTLPLSEQQKKYTFTFAGTYETKYGEVLSYATTKSVTAEAYMSAFVITQRVNQTTVVAGDSFEVAVKVKNQASTYKTVSVTDILPSGALVRAGKRENEMSLNKDEERDAYTYQVKVPESYDSGLFTITTRLYDHQGGEFYEKQVNVTVEGLPMPVIDPGPEPDSEVKLPPEPEPEKKGFVRRIIDGIIGFFEKIF